MPAKDKYHNAVKNALIKDGWTITHDPYRLVVAQRDVYMDLGAEHLAAEKGLEEIVVEIKVFGGPSLVRELEEALGQYVLYRALLNRQDPERRLFMAVSQEVSAGALDELIARIAIEDLGISLVVFDPEREVIVRWKPL